MEGRSSSQLCPSQLFLSWLWGEYKCQEELYQVATLIYRHRTPHVSSRVQLSWPAQMQQKWGTGVGGAECQGWGTGTWRATIRHQFSSMVAELGKGTAPWSYKGAFSFAWQVVTNPGVIELQRGLPRWWPEVFPWYWNSWSEVPLSALLGPSHSTDVSGRSHQRTSHLI